MKKCFQAEFEDALLEDRVFHSHSPGKEQKMLEGITSKGEEITGSLAYVNVKGCTKIPI